MKQLNRIICLILAGAIVLLTACNSGVQSNGENSSGESGRYVETDITPPLDGRFASFLTSEGTIACFGEGLVTRYDSTDGGASWVQTPGPGSNTDRYQSVSTGTLLPDGNILAYVRDEGLLVISPDGDGKQYPLADIDKAIEDGENVIVSLLKSLGNDRLIINYDIGGMVIQGGGPEGPVDHDGSPEESVRGSAPIGGRQTDVVVGDSDSVQNSQAPGPQSFQRPDSGMNDSEPQNSDPQEQTAQQRSSSQSSYSFSGQMTRKTSLLELSTGKLIADLPIENIMAATADDENIYHMDTQGNIKAYSLADGSSSNKRSVSLGGGSDIRGGLMPSFFDIGGDILAVSSDGGLYALYDRNLLLCGVDGDIDSILEGTAYTIGAPNSTAESVLALSDGSIIVNMLEGMQANRLYKYSWDENATINPDKALSVWSLEENAFVRAAIAELRKKNPDSYITYEAAMSGNDAVSAVDAIKILNTRLISGNGPDVIILDGCPAESYADKGMLLDLSDIVDTGDIYQNLLTTYISDGKTFFLPTQFTMPALMGQTDALGKAQSLDDFVNLIINGNGAFVGGIAVGPFSGIPEDERAEIYFEDLKELWDVMWLSAAPAIVKDNRLDSDALKSCLEAIKAISDKYGLADETNGETMRMGVAMSNGGQTIVLPGSLVRYTSQLTNYGAFAAGSLLLLQLMMERDGSELAPFPGLVDGSWRPSTITGIYADTSVAEFAAELLRTMLSIEVQRINYGAGLPVTREGIASQIKEINNILSESGRGTFDIDIDTLIEKLSEPSAADITLTDMMWESVEKLCSGKIDVEGAVNEIEQNVKNYLAERA